MSQCYFKIKNSISKLSASEIIVAEYIIDNPKKIISMSINELADACNTSKSTIVRFCKDLGYKGFKELCMELNSDLRISYDNLTYADITPEDPIESVIKHICENNLKTIKNTFDLINYENIKNVVDVIIKSNRVDFYGVGSSGLVAIDAQNKFMRIGKFSIAHNDPHLQIIAASSLTPDDSAVFISYSGETKDIIDTLKIAKSNGAAIISITKYDRNTVSELADMKLYTVSDETIIRSGPMSSRIGQLMIVDMLFSSVANRCYHDIKINLDKTLEASMKKKLI